jgi:hypothetical protein
MSINVDVTVEDLDLTSKIGTRQVWDGDEGHEEPITLADAVVAKLVAQAAEQPDYRTLKKRVAEIRDEEIRAAIAPAIAKAWEAPIVKTNQWGEPTGQPTTLRDLVVDEAKKVLSGWTDRSGSWPRESAPLAQLLVHKMVETELRKELSEVIKEEREKVVAAVRAQAADLIAEAVAKGVGR